MTPRAFIYIPAYGNISGLTTCLNILRKQHHDLITVIDDGNDRGFSRQLADIVRIVHHKKNRGFTASCNTARNDFLKRARHSDVFILLNSDVIPQKDWDTHLLTATHQYPDTGIFSALSLSSHDPRYVVGGGTRSVLNKRGGFIPLRSFIKSGALSQFHGSPLVPWAEFSAVLITYDCLKTCGPFDTELRDFGSDLEFCYRAHEHGFQTRYVTKSRVVHARHTSYMETGKALSLRGLWKDLRSLKRLYQDLEQFRERV